LKRTVLMAFVIILFEGTSAVAGAVNGWNHKAVNNEAKASAVVGGFSKSGARDYHEGLVYVRGRGLAVGSKTISDVVEIGKRHPRAASTPAIAATPRSGVGAGTVLLWLGIFAIVVVIMARRKRLSVIPTNAPTGPSAFELAKTCAIVPITVAGLLPHKSELFYLSTESNVAAIAEHHHAEYVGGYSGVSVRLMRGLSVRSGSSRGKKVDRTSVDVDDYGTLYLSNQRVVFVGGRKTVDIPFSRLVSVEPYVDGLKVNRTNASPLVLRTGSQREAVILQRIIANDLEAPQATRVALAAKVDSLAPLADEALVTAKQLNEAGKISDEQVQDLERKVLELKAVREQLKDGSNVSPT
jgi:hypothetical protein